MDILFGRDPWQVIAAFTVCGLLLGVLCDALYVKRLLLGSFALVRFADDLFLSLSVGVLFIAAAYAYGDGNIRWYEFPAMLIGFTLEHLTLSRCVRWLFKMLAALMHKVLNVLFSPVRVVLHVIAVKARGIRYVLYRRARLRRICLVRMR